MKKVFAVNLIIFLMFVFCSCGLTVTQQENTTVPTTAAAAQAETKAQTKTQSADNTVAAAAIQKKTSKTVSASRAETTASNSAEKTTAKKVETTKPKTEKQVTCTLEISCKNILNNREKLKENKAEFVPENGMILKTVSVSIPDGGTAFDAIKKACAENVCADGCTYCRRNGIQLDYVYTPVYGSYYIRGVHQLYEKDCGTQSGWMYSVNGVFPNYGCSQYRVKNGDIIKLLYTCDLGEDLGAE